MGSTLNVYIALRFAKTVLGILLALFALIVTIDFVELLRRFSEMPDVDAGRLYAVALLRAPNFMEKAFPFGCLFAAMITLAQLNQRMELVVARSAGVSAWQFLLPLSITAAVIGVVVSTIYNPLAIVAAERAKEISTEIHTGTRFLPQSRADNVWMRQDTGQTSAVINATVALESGRILDDVRIIRFDEEGVIIERIEARQAIYQGDHWLLIDASGDSMDGGFDRQQSRKLATNLTQDAIFGAIGDPESVGFWGLRDAAGKVRRSGINPGPYLVQYHSLTAMPLLLVAMVLIAACVSLRFVRFGQSGRLILGGISSGFVLYIVTKLVTSLGSNGIVPPVAAAWAPSVVATLFGISILLHQEDG